MPDLPAKATAQTFSAEMATERGLSPEQWSDKCFLCSREIAESDPRQFYQCKSAMMLCHTGCLNIMTTSGGKPADYHRAVAGKAAPPPAEPGYTGPGWLDFPTLAALQDYVRAKGDIPSHIKVTVARAVIQAGE